MLNYKTIYKVLGALLYIEASLMGWCLIMAIGYKEDDMPSLLVSVVVTLFFGFVLRWMGRKADNRLSRRDSYFVVTLSWTLFSLFGTLPFLLSGYITSFTDAYFETMSGFTTTGATILKDVELLPHGLLFWRSLTQWIGGLGIVFFTIALLPSMGNGSVKVFAAEATGPFRSKLHPRLSTSAKWIWTVYLVLTLACMGCYMLFGMDWFDAINFSMTSTATGGFGTYNDSIAHFHSAPIEYTSTLFCFLSGVSFTLLYTCVARLRLRALFKSSEFKFYFLVVAGFTAFIMAELIIRNHYALERAFRCAIFQVVSFITTTGLFNDDAAKWPHVTWVILATCMFIGGCSGSTGGGFKCIRLVMILKVIRNEFRQILHPNAVLPLKVDGHDVPYQNRVTLLAFLATYLAICLVASFIVISAGVDNTNAITIILSSIGNVGPTLGIEIGPTMDWGMLPAYVKWMSAFLMLVGRLEIFSVLVIFTPTFWREN
ncbi:MAG: TrkH family potassium uptake protein [Prevotella sp.]|nr:TrkH family potassium uptake protein [Prevotella sp.]